MVSEAQEQAVRLVKAGRFCCKDVNSRLARQGGLVDGGSSGHGNFVCIFFPAKIVILWELTCKTDGIWWYFTSNNDEIIVISNGFFRQN
jgi:hypothetical protein